MERDGLGALDFDVAVDARDYRVTDLALQTTAAGQSTTVVTTFRNFDKPTNVTWSLVHDGGAWKVDDVRFADGRTLRALLVEPGGR